MDDGITQTTEGSTEPTLPGPGGSATRGWWIALAVVVVAVGLLRGRLLDMPLERDEGEYAYAGQLLLDGVPPYAAAYNMKLPGVYAAYAVWMAVFGETIRGVHLGLLATNALTTLLVFLLGRRMFGAAAGLTAAAAFSVLSLNPASQGLFANAEHYVLPFAVAGILLLVRFLEKGGIINLIGSGLLFGTAVVMKQHGAAFVLVGGLTLVVAELRRRPLGMGRALVRIALFAAACLTPYALTCLLLWMAGVFDTFWFWTITYARSYTGQVEAAQAWDKFSTKGGKIMGVAVGLWALAAVGLSAVAWCSRVRRHGVLLVLFTLLSFAALTPGWFFREHYFLLLTPAAALLVGAAIRAVFLPLVQRRPSWRPHLLVVGGLVVGAAVAEPVVRQQRYLFELTPAEAVRETFQYNPFPEAVEVGEIIESFCDEDDTIAVIGSEPQLYFYTGRRSATGYIYTYPLMEVHEHAFKMHREMIREIEEAEPEILVYVNVTWSWLPRPESVQLLQQWYAQYSRGYDTVGMAEIRRTGTQYFTDLEAMRRPQPSQQFWIAVLKRRH